MKNLASKHPTAEQLAAFLNGQLSVGEQRRLEEHVSQCSECGRVLAAVPQDTLLWTTASRRIGRSEVP